MGAVCEGCAKKYYEPFFTTRRTYGPCEDCGKVHECYDVHHSQLKRKKRKTHGRRKEALTRHQSRALLERLDRERRQRGAKPN